VKGFSVSTPNWLCVRVQVLYPPHDFGVRNLSKINLNRREIWVAYRAIPVPEYALVIRLVFSPHAFKNAASQYNPIFFFQRGYPLEART